MKNRVQPLVVLVVVVSFFTLPLWAGKPAPAPDPAIPSGSTFRCPDPTLTLTCPVVETGVYEGVRGDGKGEYLGGYLEGEKVGTWVDGHHAVHLVLLAAGGRTFELDFRTPITGVDYGVRLVTDAKFDVDRATFDGKTETVGGKLCTMAVGESVTSQTWIQVRDDPEKWWTVFYDVSQGSDYTIVTRIDPSIWEVRATANQKARLSWHGKARGSKAVDKGFYRMPFVMTVRAKCGS